MWRDRPVLIGTLVTAIALAAVGSAHALPPPDAPRAGGSPSPSAAPTGAILPFGSPLLFVLDEKISSGNIVPGASVHMHLREPLIVNGITLAPEGTPATFSVITARKAQSGDEDGAIQIHLDPLVLPGRDARLPIRAYHEYLTVEHTAGQLTTLSATDSVADVFIPGHYLYHAFRSGQQMALPKGAVLRAQTDATIDASRPQHITFATPPPFASRFDTPHADLTAPPFYTPAPARPKPLPKGKATLPPTPAPSPTPPPEPSPSVPAAPSATPT